MITVLRTLMKEPAVSSPVMASEDRGEAESKFEATPALFLEPQHVEQIQLFLSHAQFRPKVETVLDFAHERAEAGAGAEAYYLELTNAELEENHMGWKGYLMMLCQLQAPQLVARLPKSERKMFLAAVKTFTGEASFPL